MSFMFNPHPYDDMNPINRPIINPATVEGFTFGFKQTVSRLASIFHDAKKSVVAIDGCPAADFIKLVEALSQKAASEGIRMTVFPVSSIYKSSDELEKQFAHNLPEDTKIDPVLLYGKLYDGNYNSIFDSVKLSQLQKQIGKERKNSDIVLLYGQGAASEDFWDIADHKVFLDLTPKNIMLRTIAGEYRNIGDDRQRSLKMVQRRIYYVDMELAVHLRRKLFDTNKLDYYIASDTDKTYTLASFTIFNNLLSALAEQPFRCKPVYIEGVWGGSYVQRIRQLPDVFKNIAWVFDLIPLEVSVLIEVGEHLLEIPYFTFVQAQGKKIMGQHINDRFNGYFPIRFNYDDTFHSSGNMSIQCHPPREFCVSEFNEHGSQDEGYYIVATGHGAKTYCGFKEGVNVEHFLELVKKSEIDRTPVPYDEYVNSIESVPGQQFLIPGGTIHASGRNQVILEIGSLSIGSYTFKLYDYLRKDFDGEYRPIHSHYGELVLARDRDSSFVKERLNIEPKLLAQGDGWQEYLVGEDPLVYYTCRRLYVDDHYDGDTNGAFHVVALVDGDAVTVRSKSDPRKCYHLNYLDIVVIPASIGEYVIENETGNPTVVYKVLVQE